MGWYSSGHLRGSVDIVMIHMHRFRERDFTEFSKVRQACIQIHWRERIAYIICEDFLGYLVTTYHKLQKKQSSIIMLALM